MKRLAIATALAVLSPMAFAVTCDSPAAVITGPVNIDGNSCGADEFAIICGGGLDAGGPSNVYQVNVGDGNDFTVTVTPSGGYDAAIYLVGPGACSPLTPCASDADDNGVDAAEQLTLNGIAAGTYYLVVDSTNLGVAPPACGPYNLAVTGTVPVELQSFSVE